MVHFLSCSITLKVVLIDLSANKVALLMDREDVGLAWKEAASISLSNVHSASVIESVPKPQVDPLFLQNKLQRPHVSIQVLHELIPFQVLSYNSYHCIRYS